MPKLCRYRLLWLEFKGLLTFAWLEVEAELRVWGAEPLLKELLLEADDRREHGLVLDLSRWDHNAAVHEVGHGIDQLPVTLGLEGCLVEHLRVYLYVCVRADIRYQVYKRKYKTRNEKNSYRAAEMIQKNEEMKNLTTLHIYIPIFSQHYSPTNWYNVSGHGALRMYDHSDI